MRAAHWLMPALLTFPLCAGMNDDPIRATLTADRFETHIGQWDTVVWDVSAYIGNDLNRAYVYTEGSADSDASESQNELVYSRAVAPFWDIQVGAEIDHAENETVGWGIIALQGLVPYYFETRTRIMISDRALGINVEAEYEALLTQKLILTPRIEAEAYSDDVPKIGLGAGLSSLEAGVRLRYEMIREFAPYIGISYDATFGNTRQYNAVDDLQGVVGLRFWF